MIEINKTAENSEISGKWEKALRIMEKCIWGIVIILVLLLFSFGITELFKAGRSLPEATNFLATYPIYYWTQGEERIFLGYLADILWHGILGFFYFGILAALVHYKIIWNKFAFGGDEAYEIGYSLILGETTTSYTTRRVALQFRPFYWWRSYLAERQDKETKLENVTTKDDSTISVTFYFAWMVWLARASIMRGIRELDFEEVTGSWKGIIKQYAADVIRQYTSAELIKNPSLIIEGIVRAIAMWKSKPLEDDEIKARVQEIVNRADEGVLIRAAQSQEPLIMEEINRLLKELAEELAFVLYEKEIETKTIELVARYSRDLSAPDKTKKTIELILANIAKGSRLRVPEEEIKKEAAAIIAGSGEIVNWATASVLKRLTVEITRNEAEIKAAGQIFDQQAFNESRRSNLASLYQDVSNFSEKAKIPFGEALNALLLTERRRGEEPSAKKVIVEGGTGIDALVASQLAGKKNP